MKIIASILIMYFGLLMVQPFTKVCNTKVKTDKSCQAGMCCKKNDHPKKADPCSNPTTCNTDFCNPFVPCGVSIIYRTAKLNFTKPVLDLLKNKKPTINEDITSDYLSDCWRPPELS